MKIYKKITLLIFLFLVYFIVCSFNYSNAVTNDISNSIFRLHIIANSNNVEDQNLKYKVRNNILQYMNTIIGEENSKEKIMETILLHLDNFKNIAQNTIYDNGYTYKVSVKIGNFEFPTKTYGDISFPPGNYDALRIEIGEAKGENWWCVMFPPLCFVDVTSGIVPEESKEILESELTDEEYELICNNSEEFKVKFKIVEVLQKFQFSGIFM